jgi:hypothetical protein
MLPNSARSLVFFVSRELCCRASVLIRVVPSSNVCRASQAATFCSATDQTLQSFLVRFPRFSISSAFRCRSQPPHRSPNHRRSCDRLVARTFLYPFVGLRDDPAATAHRVCQRFPVAKDWCRTKVARRGSLDCAAGLPAICAKSEAEQGVPTCHGEVLFARIGEFRGLVDGGRHACPFR